MQDQLANLDKGEEGEADRDKKIAQGTDEPNEVDNCTNTDALLRENRTEQPINEETKMTTYISITDYRNEQGADVTNEYETALCTRTPEDEQASMEPDATKLRINITAPQDYPTTVNTNILELYIDDETRQSLNTFVAYISARLDGHI